MMNLHSKSVNVSKDVLLAKLRENLDQHRIEYAESLIGYRVELQKHSQRLVDFIAGFDFMEGDTVAVSKLLSVPLPIAPESHESSYQDAIDMLDYSTDEVINIDQESFKAYILNNWNWMRGFKMSNSLYASSARSAGLI